jgi:dienelactone hydrolase
MSTLWYPAKAPEAGSAPASGTDKEVTGDGAFYAIWGYPVQWTNVLPQLVDFTSHNAPFTSGNGRSPLILYSHGYSCDRRLNSQIAAELASHGYIVAAVDHEDCHATVFPDDRGARYAPPGSVPTSLALVSSRLKDAQVLLDGLSLMDSNDPVLAGRLDLERIGMMGMSYGGGIAAETCRLDSRVKCMALLDGAIFSAPSSSYSELYRRGLQKPFIAMNRTFLDGGTDFSPDSQKLYTLAGQNAIWLRIKNSHHFTFTDFAWTVELTPYSRQAAQAENACLVWFFDKYLKEKIGPFPTLAEIVDIKAK